VNDVIDSIENLVKDENFNLLADSLSVLKRWKNFLPLLLKVMLLIVLNKHEGVLFSH
jgi:hypothetical protein